MPPGLIIFDCDGVLIDSEVLSAQVLVELAAAAGLQITIDHVRDHFLGRSFPTVAQTIRERFAIALPPGFEAEYRARLLARFETALQPTPGLTALLARLAVANCVATSSSPERAGRSLAIAGLDVHFAGRLFTASQVARGKPAPDLFLFAAAQMGAAPADCLVIEDSRPGLEAATAAGMQVLHYTGGSHLRGKVFDTGGAVRSLARWDDLPGLFPGILAAAAPANPKDPHEP